MVFRTGPVEGVPISQLATLSLSLTLESMVTLLKPTGGS